MTKAAIRKKKPKVYNWKESGTFSETFATAFRKGSETPYSVLAFHIIHTEVNDPAWGAFCDFATQYLDGLNRRKYHPADFKHMFIKFKEERDLYWRKVFDETTPGYRLPAEEIESRVIAKYGTKKRFLILAYMLHCMDDDTLEDLAGWFNYCVDVMME
jgi:hypothetical protein